MQQESLAVGWSWLWSEGCLWFQIFLLYYERDVLSRLFLGVGVCYLFECYF